MSETRFFMIIVATYGITILIGRRQHPDSNAATFFGLMLWLGWPIVFAIALGINHYVRFGY